MSYSDKFHEMKSQIRQEAHSADEGMEEWRKSYKEIYRRVWEVCHTFANALGSSHFSVTQHYVSGGSNIQVEYRDGDETEWVCEIKVDTNSVEVINGSKIARKDFSEEALADAIVRVSKVILRHERYRRYILW